MGIIVPGEYLCLGSTLIAAHGAPSPEKVPIVEPSSVAFLPTNMFVQPCEGIFNSELVMLFVVDPRALKTIKTMLFELQQSEVFITVLKIVGLF